MGGVMTPSSWDDDAMSDINVTPFVDVLLVLLVIFMITAPIITQMVQVDLPNDSYNKDGASIDKTLRVVIDQSGLVYVNDQQIGSELTGVNLAKFQQHVQKWLDTKPQSLFVDVAADENVRYGAIVPVIVRLKEMNVGLNLIIDPSRAP
ncbi:MAG: biopolymer transporter ExbD [SAR324 cluster bacterium]|nr:biopolymer transporter ExbD [SAR324 cluster bacterium]